MAGNRSIVAFVISAGMAWGGAATAQTTTSVQVGHLTYSLIRP